MDVWQQRGLLKPEWFRWACWTIYVRAGLHARYANKRHSIAGVHARPTDLMDMAYGVLSPAFSSFSA